MKKLKLNSGIKPENSIDGYRLNPAGKYIINLRDEMGFAFAILRAAQIRGFPPACKN